MRPMIGRVARLLAASLCVIALSACSRDNGRQADPPPVLPTYQGVIATGLALTGASTVQVGSNGTFPRTRTPRPDGSFTVPFAGLGAPYVIRGNAGDDFGTPVFAVTNARSGTVNVTPLTQLVAIELTRQDPDDYFARLLTDAGIPVAARIAVVSQFTDANIAAAQATVVRLLRQELGIVVPAPFATGDFVTTPFAHAAGDPMFDTLAAFTNATVFGDPDAYPANRVAELARCAREAVRVTLAGDFYDFCPATRETLRDPDDDSVLVYTLTNIRGSTLTLRLRGSTVLSVVLLRDGQPRYACQDAACSLIVVGGEIADQTRPLTFSNAPLTAEDGTRVSLQGTVIGGVPGRPALSCNSDQLPLFFTAADGTITGQCAAGSVNFEAVASSRYVYRDTSNATFIEVRADGATLLSVTLYATDDSGAERPMFECLGTACNGAALGGFATVDARTVTRNLQFSGTVLGAVAGGGAGPGSGTVTLDGGIVLRNRIDRVPPVCTGIPASQVVQVRVSGEADNWNVCPPYDLVEGLVNVIRVSEFNVGFFRGAQIGDLVYGFTNDLAGSESSLRIVASETGVLRRLEYQRAVGERFACVDAACLGAVTLSPANANGAHTVTIAAVTVPEILLGDRPGDRSVRLEGALLTAPDSGADGDGN